MQLSRYLKTFPAPDHPGYRIFFSTKRASLALVPEEVHEALIHSRPVDQEYSETLDQNGMLIPDPDLEQEEVFDLLNQANQYDTGLKVNVILGMACNFACPYCYEGTMKGQDAMARATANQLINFLKNRFIEQSKEKLRLSFYGGEPLLYTDQIKHFGIALQPFVEQAGGVFEMSLVTNGSLLTEKNIQELLPLGLKSAKVTVDGPAEFHNPSRPYKSGEESFDRIIANLKECSGLLKIGLGGNYTQENYHKFPELLEYLESQDLGPDRIGPVSFTPVMAIKDEYANPEFIGGCASNNEPWLKEAHLLLQRQCLQRGHEIAKLGPSPCGAEVDDHFTVHYDGTICKCVALIGRQEFVVGDIVQGITKDVRTIYHLDDWRDVEECRECVYLPLCFGGCAYSVYQHQGNLAGVDCQKKFFDASLEEIIQQDMKYRYKID